MEELRRQAQERCKERRALHGYPSFDSDSKDSVKRLTRVLGTFHVFVGFEMCPHTIFGLMFAQVTAATTTTLPFQGIAAATSHLYGKRLAEDTPHRERRNAAGI